MAIGRFRFRYDALLLYRKRTLDRLAQELAGLQRELRAEDARRAELEQLERLCIQDFAEHREGELDVFCLRDYQAYMVRLRRIVEALTARIVALREFEDAKRDEVVEASKRKKIVERLKERDKANFEKLLTEKERKFLDEIGNVRAAVQDRTL